MQEDGNKPDNSSEEIIEEWIFSIMSKCKVEKVLEIDGKRAFIDLNFTLKFENSIKCFDEAAV